MKLFKVIFLINLFTAIIPAQNELPTYYSQNFFGLTSPGAMKFGLLGYDNPAELNTLNQFDMQFFWSDEQGAENFNHWGIFVAVPHFGFGVVKEKYFETSVTDYKLSGSFGNSSFGLGIGYGWSSGNRSFFRHSNVFTLGFLIRPIPYISLGIVGNVPGEVQNEAIFDLALRPLGNETISIFGDYIVQKNLHPSVLNWSVGAAVELISGIRFTGRYYENEFFNVGAELSFGNLGISSQAKFDKEKDHRFNIYGIRVGAFDRNPFTGLFPDKNYVEVNLLGNIKYQQFRWFDNSNTLLDLIRQVDAAKADITVSGIAINISGMNINREMLWELREKLKEFKSTGKQVVIYLDRVDIDNYHFASIADKIVMDPQGTILLEGFLFGRTYFKGTLEKLGIGFTELRYFKYKSAAETFSEDKMTEADSVQWQEIINDFYTNAKDDICESRNISYEQYDSLVNSRVLFMPKDALDNGLVDAIGRWDEVKEMIKKIEGESKDFINPGSLTIFNLPEDNYWGEKPAIAIVYAIGVCDMDEGINARQLVKDVEAVTDDSNIKAVVFRVDSPGGDGLASDVVAEAIKKCGEKKPVIVSQGYVAGSGGYWLSMYADTIFSTPNTITGSIGVIGSWFYNKEFKEMLGVSTDFVKQGTNDDLGYGFTLPFIGLTLTDRDLTAVEKQKAEETIKITYKEFVGKVASGRNMDYEAVETIAQGRVWSGTDGLKNNLVDKLGGLSNAIDMAAELVDLKKYEYKLVEYPAPRLFDINQFMPKLFGIELEKSKLIEHLKFRLANNGIPMPIMPMENMDLIELK